MASSFFLSSSPAVRSRTWCSRSHASRYADRAPWKFCALSSWTAVLAFCNALESMAFCEGCFERLGFRCEEVESVLLLSPWDRLLVCPFSRYAAPSSVCGMVASRLKVEVGREGSGVARAEVDRYEVSPALDESSQKVPDSLSAPGPGK